MFVGELLFLLCWTQICVTLGDPQVSDSTKDISKTPNNTYLKESALLGLERVLSYMEADYKLLNLDAVTALRISKAELSMANRHSEPIDRVLEALSRIIDLALPIVQQYEPAYYAGLGTLAEEGFWKFREYYLLGSESAGRFISEVVRVASSTGDTDDTSEILTEDISDGCIRELLSDNCEEVSPFCVEIMTRPSAKGYTATHQVYYLTIFTQVEECSPDDLLPLIQEKKLELCSRIYLEMLTAKTDTDLKKDLFMEQIGLCGMAGYWKEFTRQEWIEEVLSWQQDSGCYGDANKFVNELKEIDISHRFKRGLRREKREERIMSDGCLSHRTSMAVLALTQNLKAME